MTNQTVGSYSQYAKHHEGTTYVEPDGKQLIDLTEVYKETDQDGTTAMVNGFEELARGVLSRKVGLALKLPNARTFDPFPSERNAREGSEGFFAAVGNNVKAFVEGIIRYIGMVLNWITNTIKTLLGIRKSDRINSAINNSLPQLREEFIKTLNGLGFPSSEYNLEKFIGSLRNNGDRITQITLMKSKFETDEKAIKGLVEVLPIIQKLVTKINRVNSDVGRGAQVFHRQINEQYKKAKVREARHDIPNVGAWDSPEAISVIKAAKEITTVLDLGTIEPMIQEMYKALYGIEFSNTELKEGFDKVLEKLKGSIETTTTTVSGINVAAVTGDIQTIGARYNELAMNELHLTGADYRDLGDIITKDTATKIFEMAKIFNYDGLNADYQMTCVMIRTYTQYCSAVMNALMLVTQQTHNLANWFNRAQAYYHHGVLNELDEMIKINIKARQEGLNPHAHPNGLPFEPTFISGADAQTFQEKLSATTGEMVKHNIGGVKDTFNNFAKQTGWGNLL